MPLDILEENARVKQSYEALSITPTRRQLRVSIKSQRLRLLIDGQLQREYPISTSKNPPSCKADSYGTPLGLHQLADKIGNGQPSGMVFRGRVPQKHFSQYSQLEQASNLITSRIIRIRGLSPGVNSGAGNDSYARYIYIHGTNHEDRIGTPFSGGCIEMLNSDVIELFDLVEPEDLLWIDDR